MTNFDSRIAAIASSKLGVTVTLVRYEKDRKGWPVPVFAVPASHVAAAEALGLSVDGGVPVQ